MKRCIKKIADISLLFLFVVLVVAGCSEDDPVEPGQQAEFQILSILSNPLAPRPGSVDTLSLRLVGSSSGERVSYSWRVSAGTLMQDDQGVVNWQVPEMKGDYTVTAIARLAGKTDSLSRTVSVRDQDIIDTGRLHSIYPNIIDGNLYFISPYYSRFVSDDERYSFADFDFYGADLYRYEDSTVSTRITQDLYNDPEPFHREMGADYFGFTDNGQKAVVNVFNSYNPNYPLPSKNIGRYDLHGGLDEKITYNMDGQSSLNRFNQFTHPTFNSDGSRIVMEFVEAGEAGDGSEDQINIAFWEEGDGFIPEIITEAVDTVVIKGFSFPVYYQNILPQYTPDGNNVIYFSNYLSVRDTLPNYYEPYVIPVVGGEPDTSQTGYFDVVRSLRVRIGRNTMFQWSPNGDMAAFSATVNMIPTLCYLNYNSADNSVSVDVTGLTKVQEFVWSPDGTMGAIIDEDGVSLVSPGGGKISDVLIKERDTDDIYGVNWSHDSDVLAFRLVRKGKVWQESWNAIMQYTLSEDMLAYISEAFRWEKKDEPLAIDYRWKRVHFDGTGGIYAPVFTSAEDDRYVSVSRIVHLY